jgi:hypothetical protein
LLKDDFSFEAVRELPAELAELPHYNGIPFSIQYFAATMDRVSGFLRPRVGRGAGF